MNFRKKIEKKRIILASPRGFCAGVKNAINTVENLLKTLQAPIYVKHEIVHNKHVVNDFKKRGVIFVEKISSIPEGAHIVFSAHGVPKSVEDEAKAKNLIIHDATCPIVKKIHKLADEYSKKNFTVILIGHKKHPEIIGTAGRISGNFIIVENTSDAKKIKARKDEKFICLTQTTLTPDETLGIYQILKKRLKEKLLPLKNNICYATKERQDAVKRIAKKCDLFIVIGSKNSSNSRRLREVAENSGVKAILIDDKTELKKNMLSNAQIIGVSSGASAPEYLVEVILKKLKKYGWEDVLKT
ncbi:MAG TPA: 4-hydroxy-3-methylbut-2-enyl diphosphate reductase [Victivallales bacterium]|nr:4-hydroxy-3-methylbut-2-enyl diphosphate reductase [Victivallales bacterium]HPO90456.1 4-hydroxy-3-methylbut-2-enyl diphosphate reductase [Victivallales bacterium]HRR06506.1 4-hydroxy-3-methylbut-2-enyl diphosphate reductase [Victivallales bacterium]HRR28307.1 4-hydroxy-3-methylbut-2-enyl diphosphate reductase [Victivallales bacterium]HRU00545.1 4-hydroxy-3-methylbut-2-enyl diphosphate reductase [Victivallales bacterium]